VQRIGVGDPRHLPHHLCLAAERDDGDRVRRAEPVDERVQRVRDEIQATGLGHRARHVDDERQRGVRPGGVALAAGLQPDAHHPYVAARLVRRGRPGAVDPYREPVALRLGIVLVEGVDELFRTYEGRVGPPSVEDLAAGVPVRGGVDVHRERRARIVAGGDVAAGVGRFGVRPWAFVAGGTAVGAVRATSGE
jgi:hypothetical protein